MMIGGTNATLTSKGNPWFFRCRPDDSIAGAAMVKYIKETLKLTKIGIVHDADAFGTGGADGVTASATAQGLQVVAREKYTTKDREFTAQLLNLKKAGTEVMVVYGTNPEDVSALQRQYRQLNPGYSCIGSPSSAMKDALMLSKESAEGLLAVTDWVPGQTQQSKTYAADYKAKYNEDMDGTAAWNFDAFNILTAAIAKANVDWAAIKDDPAKVTAARAAIAQNILNTQGYEGVLGTFNFSPNGDGLHGVSVVEIQNGQPALKQIVNVAPVAAVSASDAVTTTAPITK
jgi:branched-chain amino acid transport system substrate-binding protein